MSFYTTLHFYRPTTPPRITGRSLADFVDAFDALKVSEVSRDLTVEVLFGRGIDQDKRPTSWQETVYETISVTREVAWDLEFRCPGLRAVADTLAAHDRPVYRAFLHLGTAQEALARVDSPENEVDLYLDQWSLEIGPVTSFDLASEDPFFVGWISLSLSGYGYLYPWTLAELVGKAEEHEGIRRVMELCRTTWPVDPSRPDWRQRRMRRRMKELWPYPGVSTAWDWYWGLGESG